MEELTQARLKQLLRYNKRNGRFAWRVSCGTAKAGTEAGTLAKGYIRIRIDGNKYFAHRLAWLYVTGEWPVHVVDHKNHRTNDNRWLNLRDVPHAVNTHNFKGDRRTGIKYDRKAGNWKARIYVGGKRISLGSHPDRASARAARAEGKAIYHPTNPKNGRHHVQ